MSGSDSDEELALLAILLDEEEAEAIKAKKRDRIRVHAILKKRKVDADIFDETCKQLESYSSLKPQCVGGGRIEHDPDAKTIKVYGYSQGFGKADHEVSVGLLKKKYLDYTITCSDEGY